CDYYVCSPLLKAEHATAFAQRHSSETAIDSLDLVERDCLAEWFEIGCAFDATGRLRMHDGINHIENCARCPDDEIEPYVLYFPHNARQVCANVRYQSFTF